MDLRTAPHPRVPQAPIQVVLGGQLYAATTHTADVPVHLQLPLRLDDPTILQDPHGTRTTTQTVTATDVAAGFQVLDAAGHPSRVSGYDASPRNDHRGARITNIVGADANSLIKRCPHCKIRKPFADFGEERTTNELRDQSYCTECRTLAFGT
ncbi:MAG: hypothetical protein B7733_22970 [Myxococcales bacterium FL481]|nr:MAG: hypothetical protein B7733_22970 [Myxococcales bacterium FL481]